MSADPNLDNFVGLSAILTGYSQDQLAPSIDPIGLASEYLAWIEKNVDQATLQKLLSTFQNIATQPPADQPAQVQQQILADPSMGDVARRIMRLWYLSTWYTTEPPDPNGDGQVVSMNAYTMGLAWDAAQAHPMGYSELHFGYWAVAPPANEVSPNAFPAVNVASSGDGPAPAEGPTRLALQRGGI